MRKLLDALPLDLDGVDDQTHSQDVRTIRLTIVSQWAKCFELWRRDGDQSQCVIDRVREQQDILRGIIQEYSQVMAFAPDPLLPKSAGEQQMHGSFSTGGSPSESPGDASSLGTPTSLSPSDGSAPEVAFEIKFLQAGDDVWTVLQALNGLKLGEFLFKENKIYIYIHTVICTFIYTYICDIYNKHYKWIPIINL